MEYGNRRTVRAKRNQGFLTILAACILAMNEPAGGVNAGANLLGVSGLRASQTQSRSRFRPTNECNSSATTVTLDTLDSTSTPVTIEALGSIHTTYGIAGFVIDESGDYSLNRNLQLSNQDIGILILAEHVTLNLNQHRISDPLGSATLIEAVDSESVTVRDGRLEGGARGIVASADRFSVNTRLTVQRLAIVGLPTSTLDGVTTDGVFDVRVHRTHITGIQNGISIISSFTTAIEHNRIETREMGAYVESLIGEVRSNIIKGSNALSVYSGTVIERNTIVGSGNGRAVNVIGTDNRLSMNRILGTGGDCAIRVGDNSNWVSGNRIEGDFASLLCLHRSGHLISDNRFVGGTQAGVSADGGVMRIANNWITSGLTGIKLSESTQNIIIEGNRVNGVGLECGVDFDGSSQNVYRANAIEGARQEVCGEANIDGGDWQDTENTNEGCDIAERGCKATELRRWADRGVMNGRMSHFRRSAGTIPLGEIHPSETSFGSAALVITEPGYYVLTNDIAIPQDIQNGILIVTSDVVLDLGGHTISALESTQVTIRIVSLGKVTVRDGSVVGGLRGLTFNGGDGDNEQLRVEELTIARSSIGLEVNGIRKMEILSSIVGGDSFAALITGDTRGSIVSSYFGAEKVALLAPEFNDAEIVGSLFHGGTGLWIGSGNLVADDVISGTTFGRSLVIGERNWIQRNHIYGERAIWIEKDQNLIRENFVDSSGTGITVLANRNRIAENMIRTGTGYTGIEVHGAENELSGNLFVKSRCAIEFADGGETHSYLGNIALGVTEGICGSLARDEGGNVIRSPFCGNEVRSSEEICDGVDIGIATCQNEGYADGTLGCTETCDGYRYSHCRPGECGNGLAEYGEACDGSDLGGFTCENILRDEGTLACTEACQLDTSGCMVVCGNGTRLWPEVCDGSDLGGASCQSQGFGGGILACNSTCDGYDTSGCS